jgi:hypothetical protein
MFRASALPADYRLAGERAGFFGGGVYTTGHYLGNGYNPVSGPTSLTILASTFIRNEADGGLGGAGGLGGTAGADGSGIGGGLYIAAPTVQIDAKTRFLNNKATTSNDDIFGSYING